MTVVGLDDTDSRERGMCTTYAAARLADRIRETGGRVERLLLVRLNPAVEHKTRGNAALAIHTDLHPARALELAVAELEPLAESHDRAFEVRELSDPTGIATEPKFDYLIVSPETRNGGERINEIRRERGHEPLEIEVVDHVMAEDGERISSTRIVEGEIDRHGNVTPDRNGRGATRPTADSSDTSQ